jgi:hypothetical protein
MENLDSKYGSLTEQEYQKLVANLAAIGISKETIDLMIADELRQQLRKEKNKKVIVSHGESYYLRTLVHCTLCGASHHTNFYMEARSDGLHSRPVEFVPEDAVIKTTSQEVEACCLCEVVLQEVEKEVLVASLIYRAKNPKYIKIR